MGACDLLLELLQGTGETRRQQLIVSTRGKHLTQSLRCHFRRRLRPRSIPVLDDAIAHPERVSSIPSNGSGSMSAVCASAQLAGTTHIATPSGP